MKNLVLVFFLICSSTLYAQTYCKDTAVNYQFKNISLKYPTAALEAGIQGQVIILLDVDSTCALVDRRVIKGIGYGCDEEALKSMDEAERKLKVDNKSRCCQLKNIKVPITYKLR